MPSDVDVVAIWKISVSGSPLSDSIHRIMVSATVENSFIMPDMAIVELSDPESEYVGTHELTLGNSLTVDVVTGDGGSTNIFSGEITAIEAVFDPLGTRTVIRAYDKTHRLLRGRKTKAWVQMTYSDIVTQIVQSAAVPIGTIEPTTPVHPHTTQAAVEDWFFVRQLADAIGYRIGMAEGKFSFTRPKAPPRGAQATVSNDSVMSYCPGDRDLLRLRVAMTGAGSATEVTFSGFDPAQKKRVSGSAMSATRANATMETDPSAVASPFGSAAMLAPWNPVGPEVDTTAAAQAIFDRIGSMSVEVQAEVVGNAQLTPGSSVTIGGVGGMLAGTFTLSATRHFWDQHAHGYRTSFTVNDRQDRSLLGVVNGGLGTPLAGGRMSGVVTGLVTNIQDDGGMCRVKVKFPWLSDDYESDWARTVQLGAGSSRGFQILPEVDDEVLVAFEQGDLNRPMIVGGVHNGTDHPPSSIGEAVQSGKVVKRQFVSRHRAHADFRRPRGGQGRDLGEDRRRQYQRRAQ